MQLYKIADEIERILASEVDRETGEISDETLEKLAELEMGRDAKALAVAAYLKGELAEAEAGKVEAEKLKKRATVHENRAKRLVEYLQNCIPQGSDPISDARSKIAWRKNPPKVSIPDAEAVPPKFQRVVPETRAPDKKAILDALKAGASLPFAVLMRSNRLEIK